MLMKTSSAPRRLERATARNCILINQLATPGLGSIMAGQRLVGTGQLLVAVLGFLMVVGWFVLSMINTYNAAVNDAEPRPVGWLGRAGAYVFCASWLWALSTSLKIHRSLKSAPDPAAVPPRLS